jgi:hypothetical protein
LPRNRRIEVVNRKVYKHTHLVTDEGDIVTSRVLQRAVRRVGASLYTECHFYWNDVEVCLHLVKYDRAELRVKRDGRVLSEYVDQEKRT